ncbi:endolytic transglycosylase MltG [Candidatus Nomurabacteria bacterium]|nr:endolytic transglycosylase MltG [Candidatus Nomurabacteria bacterium]
MKSKKYLNRAIVLIIFLVFIYFLMNIANKTLLAPKNFPVPYRITIDSGQTLFSVSKELYEDGAIKNKRVFEMLMITFGNENRISEGDYYFEKPTSVVEIALRISGKDFGIEKEKITLPEGFSNIEMANRLEKTLTNFDKERFLSLTKGKEGYLFPDTYGFFPSVKTDFVVETLEKNFEKKIKTLETEFSNSKRSLSDIIIMASIIEKEAKGSEDRALVSGILWNRIDAGIALQVDAPFLYILGKQSSELTIKDLATKSAFNTYINKGLPPSPINNPGLAAIKAALNPEKSDYFYYLHDKNGNIYYAKTYTQHKENIKKYLK